MAKKEQQQQQAAADEPLITGPVPPVYNPRIRYTLVFPDGRRQTKGSTITGWVGVRDIEEFLEPTLLHTHPIHTRIENLRAVNRKGEAMPVEPLAFRAHRQKAARRGASPKLAAHLQAIVDEEGNDAMHPGVKPWNPAPASQEVYDDDAAETPDAILQTPDPEKAVEPTGPQSASVNTLPRAARK